MISEIYKDLYKGSTKDFADNVEKEMESTNAKLWQSGRFIFYPIMIFFSVISAIGCSYGIYLYLVDSMPEFLAIMLGIMTAVSIETGFIVAYHNGLIKALQGREAFKFAIPYLILSCFYVLTYFPVTNGFQSFVKNKDKQVKNYKLGFSQDSLRINQYFNPKIDSLNNLKKSILLKIELTDNSRLQSVYNKEIDNISKFNRDYYDSKQKELNELKFNTEANISKAEKNIVKQANTHFNLALIIMIFVFIFNTVICVIKHHVRDEKRKLTKYSINQSLTNMTSKSEPFDPKKKISMN